MVVLVLSACPAGLRGHLTRWFLEISPGVFVGVVSAKVRQLAWERIVDLSKDGRAIMIHTTRGEQRLAFKVHRHDWEPIDLDGIHLMRRPHTADQKQGGARSGWSKASRYHRASKRRRHGDTNESE
ncbi:type I-E CRISPR-associated endoribonuclease Cas2 [Nocardia cyriacigeorgica]|uniref:type I-E CRISPR-associated endoribonuclease Cas2e n=1 Tax=Nocardia cyriacigeorgica TaxID=135487 RepID=UPI0013B6C495|nr:type I-E CRISPR-associated endoribonuclease Cas2e [Nocardia cyriacigeorgica]NEW51654.1 type I-E CRISPR-associated endoribonuclease Cas2 [Nocardia cyriacigeorgica]